MNERHGGDPSGCLLDAVCGWGGGAGPGLVPGGGGPGVSVVPGGGTGHVPGTEVGLEFVPGTEGGLEFLPGTEVT